MMIEKRHVCGRCGKCNDVDRYWRALTNAANKAFVEGQMTKAANLYEDALEEAEKLFSDASRGQAPADIASMLLVSSNNLAEWHMKRDERAETVFLLKQVLKRLETGVSDRFAPRMFRQACYSQLRPALADFAHYAALSGASMVLQNRVSRQVQTTALAFIQEFETTQ